MIDVFDLWERLCGEVNTHQGGHIRPNRNFINWVNTISAEMFEEKFAKGYRRNQKNSDDLGMPFLRSKITKLVNSQPTYDIIPYPEEYGHFSACRFFWRDDESKGEEVKAPDDNNFYYKNVDTSLHEKAVTDINEARWGSIGDHAFLKPSVKLPYCTQCTEGFKVAPKGIGFVVIDYLKKPVPATFDYDLGASDEIIYNASNSVKLEWNSVLIPEFIARLKPKYFTFIREVGQYQNAITEKLSIV